MSQQLWRELIWCAKLALLLGAKENDLFRWSCSITFDTFHLLYLRASAHDGFLHSPPTAPTWTLILSNRQRSHRRIYNCNNIDGANCQITLENCDWLHYSMGDVDQFVTNAQIHTKVWSAAWLLDALCQKLFFSGRFKLRKGFRVAQQA